MMGVSVPPQNFFIALVSFLGCRLMYAPCSMVELARIPPMFNGLMAHFSSHAPRLRGVFFLTSQPFFSYRRVASRIALYNVIPRSSYTFF